MARKQATDRDELLRSWQQVPREIEAMIAGLSDDDLASLPGSEGLSLKAVVHHLVEANIVAATMILAALGASGCTFDWSWLWPNKEWTERLGYARIPIAPSLATLRSLTEHVSNLVNASDDTLQRKVMPFDKPGAETYPMTVEQIIRNEIDHAEQHLADVKAGKNNAATNSFDMKLF